MAAILVRRQLIVAFRGDRGNISRVTLTRSILCVAGLLAALFFLASPASALQQQQMDRQSQLRQQRLGKSSLRFQYSNPEYFHRKSPGQVQCVQLGQARCMNRGEPKQQRPNKYSNPIAENFNKLHPLLRGKYKYKANSLFEE